MENAEPAVVPVPPEPMEGAPAANVVAAPAQPAQVVHAAAEAVAVVAREVYQTTKKRDAVVVDGYVMIKHFVSANGRVQHWRSSGAGANNSPSGKRPIRAAACRGIELRRFHAQRQLNMLDDDVDLFADDDDSDASGSSPGARMANMSVKDEVVDDASKENVNDFGPDPWGGIPAPDPWTLPDARGRQQETAEGLHHYRPMRAARALDEDAELPSSSAKPVKTEKNFGAVGGLFADYFASQARAKRATLPLPAKRVKTEPISDDDSAKHGSGVGPQRKRRLGQHTSPSVKLHKVGVITLSDDEDVVARLPAKKAKKFEEDVVVYVLSSDSEDHLDPEES